MCYRFVFCYFICLFGTDGPYDRKGVVAILFDDGNGITVLLS